MDALKQLDTITDHIDKREWCCDECDKKLGEKHVRHNDHYFCSWSCADEYADRYGGNEMDCDDDWDDEEHDDDA